MSRKALLAIITTVILVAVSGCNTNKETNTINVVSRETGSGTRGAFIELFGIEEKGADGTKVDKTTKEAIQLDGTQKVMSNIAGDKNAIGYISLGSLNDTVKAVKIDGAVATVDNIKSGTYKVSRPFNIATKGEVSASAQDFINFILSAEGQAVVEANGYISEGNTGAFTSNGETEKIVIAGSSSVTPLMEKLQEAYEKINTNADIEIQLSDSSIGMQSAIDGICDIGMASRELKDSEKAELDAQVIALDGIAVIVNKDNSVNELSSETVKKIFIGEITSWEEVE